MHALLICPGERAEVQHLSRFAPLAAFPILGESLIEYWLTHLAETGVKDVKILADDRPELISTLIGNGARWGLKAEVIAESRELPALQAQLRHPPSSANGTQPPQQTAVLDHFPGCPQSCLFASYATFFSGVLEWLPNAITMDRVGMHEVRPGVWMATNARVSPEAELIAPCWIGKNVYVGGRATVGPLSILEDRAFVEPGAAVIGSLVGPDTFVGQLASIRDSLAWGNALVHWSSGVCAHVQDAFVLCALRRQPLAQPTESVADCLAERSSRAPEDDDLIWKQFLLNNEEKEA